MAQRERGRASHRPWSASAHGLSRVTPSSTAVREQLSDRSRVTTVLASPESGKTSLLARAAASAASEGWTGPAGPGSRHRDGCSASPPCSTSLGLHAGGDTDADRRSAVLADSIRDRVLAEDEAGTA